MMKAISGKLYQGSPAEADQLGENGLQSGKGG